jgi:hypothetical protein
VPHLPFADEFLHGARHVLNRLQIESQASCGRP